MIHFKQERTSPTDLKCQKPEKTFRVVKSVERWIMKSSIRITHHCYSMSMSWRSGVSLLSTGDSRDGELVQLRPLHPPQAREHSSPCFLQDQRFSLSCTCTRWHSEESQGQEGGLWGRAPAGQMTNAIPTAQVGGHCCCQSGVENMYCAYNKIFCYTHTDTS